MIYRALCDYLGTAPQWSSESVLSRPDASLIEIDANLPLQQCLYQAITRAYDVRNDDSDLRRSAALPESERGAYFDKLRKDYPRRREFSQYTVHLNQASVGHSALVEALKGLGFQLSP